MSVLSVAGQLIRWEHTPAHFSVDFWSLHIVLHCIHLHFWTWKHLRKPKIGAVKIDRVWILNWSRSLQQVRNNHYFLKSGQVGGGRQVGGSGARSSCQYTWCTCAATCPHTHLPNNHPAQQDLLPLECVNHVSHTVALITARYVIAFILMCYFPAARPWLSKCVANKGVWSVENPCLVRCCLRSPWATWSWWCDDAKRIHCRARWTACQGGQILKQ